MSTNQNKAMETLDRYIRARYSLIGVVSHEETHLWRTGHALEILMRSYSL